MARFRASRTKSAAARASPTWMAPAKGQDRLRGRVPRRLGYWYRVLTGDDEGTPFFGDDFGANGFAGEAPTGLETGTQVGTLVETAPAKMGQRGQLLSRGPRASTASPSINHSGILRAKSPNGRPGRHVRRFGFHSSLSKAETCSTMCVPTLETVTRAIEVYARASHTESGSHSHDAMTAVRSSGSVTRRAPPSGTPPKPRRFTSS